MRASPQIVPDTCAPGPAMRRCKRSCRAALHRPCHSDSGQVKLLMLWSLCGRVAAASHNRKCLRTSPERSDARVRFAARAARSAPRRRKPFQNRTRCRRRVGQAPRAACAGCFRRRGNKRPRPRAASDGALAVHRRGVLCPIGMPPSPAYTARQSRKRASFRAGARVKPVIRAAPPTILAMRIAPPVAKPSRPRIAAGMRRPRQGQTNASTALIPHTALLTYAAHGRIINCGIA